MHTIIYRICAVVLILGILANLWLGLSPHIRNDRFPSIFGYSYLQVDSGSMAPTIHTGDAIVIRKDDTYASGDVITFYQDERYITHRIQKLEGNQLITKGDANNAADPRQVTYDEIYGRVIWTIPKGGIVLNALHDPRILIGIGCSGLLFWLALRLYRKQKCGEHT